MENITLPYPFRPLTQSELSGNTVSWTLSTIASITLLLTPALWNGFALIFYDSGGYAGRVLQMTLAPGRSFFYGLFLWLASLNWWSFNGPIIVQAILAVWVIRLMLRCHAIPDGPFINLSVCAALALFTSISWYTSQLMPDILVPLAICCLWLYGFCWEQLTIMEKGGLFLTASLGMLSHMTCMALSLGLLLVTFFLYLIDRRTHWLPVIRVRPVLLLIGCNLFFMPAIHGIFFDMPGFTPGGPAFIFGRLMQDGITTRWLAEHCPVEGIKLCALQDRLPETADEFLWNGGSPFQDIGGWGAADGELGYLVRRGVMDYPLETIVTSIAATGKQLVMVASADGLDEFHDAARGTFTHDFSEAIALSFSAAKQQQELLTWQILGAINLVHVPIAIITTFALPLLMLWTWRNGLRYLCCLCGFTFTALLGNAFICGALSGPHHRYQSRVVWLALLVTIIVAYHWWQKRKGMSEAPSVRSKIR